MKAVLCTIFFIAIIFIENSSVEGRPENIFQKVPDDLKFENPILEKPTDTEIQDTQNLTLIHTYPPSRGLSGTSYKSMPSPTNVD